MFDASALPVYSFIQGDLVKIAKEKTTPAKYDSMRFIVTLDWSEPVVGMYLYSYHKFVEYPVHCILLGNSITEVWSRLVHPLV